MKQFIAAILLLPLPVFVYASYQDSANRDLTKKQNITARTAKIRYRVSDNTKLTKIYFMDLKTLSFDTSNKKNLTR